MLLFFFFKQKTAYDMRISDWSSDVCSSDLAGDNRCNWQIRHAAGQRSHPDRRLPASGNDRRGSSGPEAEPFPPTAATPRSPRRRQDRSVPGRHPKPLAPSVSRSILGHPHRLLEQIERDVAAAQYRRALLPAIAFGRLDPPPHRAPPPASALPPPATRNPPP